MNDRYIFNKLQNYLLFLINRKLVRSWVGIRHELDDQVRIIFISPNSYAFSQNKYVIHRFRTYNLFAKRLHFLIQALSFCLLPLAHFTPMVAIALRTEDYFSGSGDGFVNITGQGSWAAAHDAGTGSNADSTSATATVICQPAADGGWRIDRIFLPFDTSAIPDGVTLTSGSLNLTLSAKTDNVVGVTIEVVTTTQASTSTLATSDFGNISTTAQATGVTLASFTVDTNKALALNATGLSNVSLSGFTKFGLRTSHDLNNSACTNSASNTSAATFYMSEQASTNKDPYLEVVYPGGNWLGKYY